MIRLGHIVYSNCFPVHALLVDGERPQDVTVVAGTPSELNEKLASGSIDVAPCSSIEYARHAGAYRVLPGLAIASKGAVQSILLESTVPAEELTGREVLVPTASATSIVLLRILLEVRLRVRPRLRWFDQSSESEDALAAGGAAALFIGDVALRRSPSPERIVLDLGEEWTTWTGLPFVYALWQARADADHAQMVWLHGRLVESRAFFNEYAETLAARHASHFGIAAGRLARYWRSLHYVLDADAMRGLLHFYRLAADIGEAPAVTGIRFVDTRSS